MYFFIFLHINRFGIVAQLPKPFDFGLELRRYLLENRLPAIAMLAVANIAFRNLFSNL